MYVRCQHNDLTLQKADKKTTCAPGNASGMRPSNLSLILNPCAKPFIQPFQTKSLVDLLTLKFMAFCIILSLSMRMNLARFWNYGDEPSFFDVSSPEVITECWNEFNVTEISDIPLIVNISTPNITGHEEWDPRDESNLMDTQYYTISSQSKSLS